MHIILKKETALHHQRAEKALLLYLKNLTTSEAYIQVLQAFYGFFAPLHTSIKKFIGVEQLRDFDSRRHAAWIVTDLNALGTTPHANFVCNNLPGISTSAAAWGCLYVLEGSTLGGQHIVPMLQKILPGSSHQFSFFSSYGNQTQMRWQLFLKALEQQPPQPQMITAAQETFSCLQLHFQKHLHESNYFEPGGAERTILRQSTPA